MRVKVATHSGFCFGVKRAINIAETTLKDPRHRKNIYSLGPIIHNPQVVSGLSKKGLAVTHDIDNIKKGAVIISSHGAPKDLIQKIKRKRIKLIDATCPFVKHAHDIVRDLEAEGYRIVIIGDKSHPEVKALLSLAGNRGTTRKPRLRRGTRSHAEKINSGKIGIVSQTTQNKDDYIRGVLDLLKDDFSELRIFNTICRDTAHRQILTCELLDECDVMIVVGGKNSANTRRLHQICKESRVDTHHIETEQELRKDYFKGKKCAGVVSGASTPDTMVKKVVERIRRLSVTRDEGRETRDEIVCRPSSIVMKGVSKP